MQSPAAIARWSTQVDANTCVAVAGPVVALIATYAVLSDRRSLVLAVLVAAIATVLALRPRWSVYGFVLLATTALPTWAHTTRRFAGQSVRYYEVLLAVALMYVLLDKRLRPSGGTLVRAAVFLGVVLMSWFVDANSVTSRSRATLEALLLMDMVAAYVVAAAVTNTEIGWEALKALRVSLWISAPITIAGSVGLLTLAGHTEETGLAGTLTGGTRLLTAAQFPAAAVASGCLALIVSGRKSFRSTWTYLLPALAIMLFAFSRNHLIMLAVATLVGLLMSRSLYQVTALAARVLVVAVILVPLYLLGTRVFASTAPVHYVTTQVTSYRERVLAGLTGKALATDPSAQYRLAENNNLIAVAHENTVMGHGLGYAFQPPTSTDPRADFGYNVAPYYGHNFYLWWLVVAGIVGLCAFAWVFAAPALVAFRSRSPAGIALAPVLVALLVTSAVAPLPEDAPNSVVLGAVAGALVAIRRREVAERT